MRGNFFNILNAVLMTIFASMAIFTPLYSLQKMAYMLTVFASWYLTSALIEPQWFKNSFKYIVVLVLIVILDYIIGLVNNDSYAMLDGINKTPIFCWAIFALFYSKHLEIAKPTLYIIFVLLAISSLLTIQGNLLFPGASRLLASSGNMDTYEENRQVLRQIFVGGYDFIYCLVFLMYPLVLLIKSRKPVGKALLIALGCLYLSAIILGAYMIGILIAVFSVILGVVDVRHFNIGKVVFICLLCILLKDAFLGMLESVGTQYDITALTRHSEELATGSYSSSVDQENNRLYIYWGSVQNWLKSPILGFLIGKPENLVRAGHSEMLGFLERYGLFSFVYFLFFKYLYFDVKNTIQSPEFRKSFKLYFLIFVFFGFIDRFDRFFGIGFMAFYMGPLIIMLLDKENSENRDNSMRYV